MVSNVDMVHSLLTMFGGAANIETLARDLDETLIPQFVMHGSALCPLVYGRDPAKQRVLAAKAAFPDAVVTIDHTLSEGLQVMAHAQVEGTHDGEWQGIPATGNRVAWTVTGILRFNDEGHAVEGWLIEDSVALLQQLGRLPLIPGQPDQAR